MKHDLTEIIQVIILLLELIRMDNISSHRKLEEKLTNIYNSSLRIRNNKLEIIRMNASSERFTYIYKISVLISCIVTESAELYLKTEAAQKLKVYFNYKTSLTSQIYDEVVSKELVGELQRNKINLWSIEEKEWEMGFESLENNSTFELVVEIYDIFSPDEIDRIVDNRFIQIIIIFIIIILILIFFLVFFALGINY